MIVTTGCVPEAACGTANGIFSHLSSSSRMRRECVANARSTSQRRRECAQVYVLHVSLDTYRAWVVHRRYSQFAAADAALRARGARLPPLPPKGLLAGRGPAFLAARRAGLAAWLSAAVDLFGGREAGPLADFLCAPAPEEAGARARGGLGDGGSGGGIHVPVGGGGERGDAGAAAAAPATAAVGAGVHAIAATPVEAAATVRHGDVTLALRGGGNGGMHGRMRGGGGDGGMHGRIGGSGDEPRVLYTTMSVCPRCSATVAGRRAGVRAGAAWLPAVVAEWRGVSAPPPLLAARDSLHRSVCGSSWHAPSTARSRRSTAQTCRTLGGARAVLAPPPTHTHTPTRSPPAGCSRLIA